MVFSMVFPSPPSSLSCKPIILLGSTGLYRRHQLFMTESPEFGALHGLAGSWPIYIAVFAPPVLAVRHLMVSGLLYLESRDEPRFFG